MAKEAKYLDLLKETKMMNYIGKGPKDPAPKDKKTKTSTEEAPGEGTEQAGTVTPNQIPKVKDIAKKLAKEGLTLDDITGTELIELIKTRSKGEVIKSLIKPGNIPEKARRIKTTHGRFRRNAGERIAMRKKYPDEHPLKMQAHDKEHKMGMFRKEDINQIIHDGE